jgi:hypothetical protein
MNPLLADWYNEVSIALASDTAQARARAADQLLPSLTRTRVLTLVGLAHGHPDDQDQHDWFSEAFKVEDASFLLRGNDREVALLAGACLIELFNRGDDLAVFAASACAVAAGRGWSCLINDLAGAAEQRLHDLGTARRQVPPTPSVTNQVIWPKSAAAKAITQMTEETVTAESIVAALTLLADNANAAFAATATQINQVGSWAEDAINLCTEEGNLISWLLSGYSETLGISWASIDASTAAIVAGRELVAESTLCPPAPQGDALLDQLLAATPFDESPAKMTIPLLDVPGPLEFLVDQLSPDSGTPTILARQSLRQATLLDAWDKLE